MNHSKYSGNGARLPRIYRTWIAAVVAGWLATNGGRAQNLNLLWSFDSTANNGGSVPMAALVQGPDGTLYGTTQGGGAFGGGVVFKTQPDGTGMATLKDFSSQETGSTNDSGSFPMAKLALAGNVLYGTTSQGGDFGQGTVFKMNADGTGFATIYSFSALNYSYFNGNNYIYTNGDGGSPQAGLALSGNCLYGTASQGGNADEGTVFKINTDGTGFATLHDFSATTGANTNSDGATPRASLIIDGNMLYGTASLGGVKGFGVTFRVNTDGTGFTNLISLTLSETPQAELVLAGNTLYGTGYGGGIHRIGAVYRIHTDGTGFGYVHNFSGSDGEYLRGGLILSGGLLYGTTSQGGTNGEGSVFAVNTNGSGFNELKSFSGGDGENLIGGLMLAGNTLFGTASAGGVYQNGTLFKINTDGTGFTLVKSFGSGYGITPVARLLEAGGKLYGVTYGGTGGSAVYRINPDGSGYTSFHSTPNATDGGGAVGELVICSNTLYGTTTGGGSNGVGTIFAINTDGSGYEVLHSFSGFQGNPDDDGCLPYGGLVVSNGVLYGTTYGYDSSTTFPYGSVFRMNVDGNDFTNLYAFTGGADGANPFSSLVLAGNVLYGTSTGIYGVNYGSVFKINTDGTGFTALKTFLGGDGANPYGGLVLGGQVLFGTTESGTPGSGTIFAINTNGTGFATLYSFNNGFDGANPYGTMALSGSTLYGTAMNGGFVTPNGTMFQIHTNGSGFNVLTSFGSFGYSANPQAGLTLYGGVLYGVTQYGGRNDQGALFSWTLPGYPIHMNIRPAGGAAVVSWSDPMTAFSLQAAPTVAGIYTNVPGAWSPYTNTINGSPEFFRLIAN